MTTTPGPWFVETDVVHNGDIHIFAPGLHPIAQVDCREHPDDLDDPPRETALANAAVMAAGPDLLQAVHAALSYVVGHGNLGRGTEASGLQAKLRAAIAKAESK